MALPSAKHIWEKNNTLGIVMLSAKSQEMDKVNGLMLGAMTTSPSPFSPSELVARVDAVYRRVSVSSAGGSRRQNCAPARSSSISAAAA